jgi:hypothetical protein
MTPTPAPKFKVGQFVKTKNESSIYKITRVFDPSFSNSQKDFAYELSLIGPTYEENLSHA